VTKKQDNIEYTALSSIEGIRTRPSMYMGSTESYSQLITEALDNAIDEVANKYATYCKLYFNLENHIVQIDDNGRGLKSYMMKDANGIEKDSIVLLCTETHTGSKFDTTQYHNLLGQNGVGLVIINALSNYLVIRSRNLLDRKQVTEYIFRFSELYSKQVVNDTDDYSTQIQFQPNKQFFDTLLFDLAPFINRLKLAQATFPTANFYFNNKPVTKRTLKEYVAELFKINPSALCGFKINSINAFIGYQETQDINIEGDVNLRICDGTYLTNFQTLIKNILIKKFNHKYKNINPNLFLLGITAYISLKIPEPQFDSQTKTRMTSNVNNIIQQLEKSIIMFFSNSNILKIIESNIERKLHKKLIKITNNKVINATNKLSDCKNKIGDVLYIVEGDSAAGPLKRVRNVYTEAIFPLKGKILNVLTANSDKINNNKEITDLLEALGPKHNRRYQKIKILTDADVDGAQIAVLIILVLQKFADDMIKSNSVSVLIPPLYAAIKKKEYAPLYYEEKLQYYIDNNYEIERFKGLGQMEPYQLKDVIRSNIEYVLKWPDTKAKLDNINQVILDSDFKRLLLQHPKFCSKTILEHVLSERSKSTASAL